MAYWRIGRGSSDRKICRHLEDVALLGRNYEADPEKLRNQSGWYTYGSESKLGRGPIGPPVPFGPFQRASTALRNFEFSDRRIVRAFFDEDSELLGRTMVLELRAFRALRYLVGVRVGSVAAEEDESKSQLGFRYDTLEGHIERGAEWFMLRKDHDSGTINFRISACWQPGDFPNWWSRIGFKIVGRHYQEKWHRHAHEYMARLVQQSAYPFLDRPAPRTALPDIIFEERKKNA